MRYSLLIFLLTSLISSNFYSQNLILNSLDTSLIRKVKLEIKSDKIDYNKGEKIKIQYTFYNISDTDQKILIKNYYGFPMGMGATIMDDNDTSICKYSSRHILASQIFTEKQLKNNYKTLRPGQKFSDDLILQDVPVFEDYSRDYIIPYGEYSVIMTYYNLISNKIVIEIKK